MAPKPRHRGERGIPKWELKCMIGELQEAQILIGRGMREQHNKDVVTGNISREITELKKELLK